MSDEKALAAPNPRWIIKDAQERFERKKLRQQKRELTLKSAVTDIQLGALRDMRLKELAFLTDDELKAKGLSDAAVKRVRGWELPKRHAPFALESSSTIATSMVRGEREKNGGVGINVEKLIVKLPERGGAELPAAIVIDAEVLAK